MTSDGNGRFDVLAAARAHLAAERERQERAQRDEMATFLFRVRDGLGADLYDALRADHGLAAHTYDGILVAWTMGADDVWGIVAHGGVRAKLIRPDGQTSLHEFDHLRAAVLTAIALWDADHHGIDGADRNGGDIAEQETMALDGAALRAGWEARHE